MRVPRGYCDLRVDRVNDDIIKAYAESEYAMIAVNTIIDCSLLNIGSSNKKKRKIEECNDEKNIEKQWVPAPKLIKYDEFKLTVLNRLTIQITNFGQLQKVMSSPNFKLYDILAVEPLNDQVLQQLVTSTSVDIITCNTKTAIAAKDYTIAIDKKIHLEICYGPMLINSSARQEAITLAHLLHIKGKSKNVIVSSGAVNVHDIRNPHDVMNLCILLGLSKQQSKDAITRGCHSVIIKSYGRKLGKSAIYMEPKKM